MQLDGHDPRPGVNQVPGDGAPPGTDVEHQLAGPNSRAPHNAGSPGISERMPPPGAPRLPGLGHDAPSRST
jgi:hypothetical protein